MDIMTADGVRNFYNPETPDYPPEHIARVRDYMNHMNSETIAGWERKFPVYPKLVFEEQLKLQVCSFVQALAEAWPQQSFPTKMKGVV